MGMHTVAASENLITEGIGDDLERVRAPEAVSRELELAGERRSIRFAGVNIAGRRRRPSGERAPLPWKLHRSGKVWLATGVSMVIIWVMLYAMPATMDFWQRTDTGTLERLGELRTTRRTNVANAINGLAADPIVRTMRIGALLSLAFVRRWRHFFAVIIAVFLVEASVELLSEAIGRPRPFVSIIGEWEGPSHPSAPVAALTSTLVVSGLALIPRSRARHWFLAASAAIVVTVSFARLYLGVDHPTDALVAAAYAAAVSVITFKVFAPESVFPVNWKRGVKAHLDVDGARGTAIRQAVADQLGLHILEIEPFGQEGSGGSTPLRFLVAGDPPQFLFAKLYSQTHLRSDRWYKLGRAILYGSLEDEVRFGTVRRLVEYEDYIQRVMRDSGIPSAHPIGVVEITPEREYLMLSEFLADSVELSAADVDDPLIDEALSVVRAMWDAGLAHRDIKPANVMVRDGHIVLIDVAFGTIRPSPWRQAVDLANMMVILALRTSPDRVYARALRQFAPADIGEAFAATRSITLPSQSRSSLAIAKRDYGIDIVEEFRKLAPPTEAISIQRWSPRRIALTVGAFLGIAMLLLLAVSQVTGQGFL